MRKIPLTELVSTSKTIFSSFELSATTIQSYMVGVKSLYSYMDTQGVKFYDRSIGELFTCYEQEHKDLSCRQLTNRERAIRLLDIYIEGRTRVKSTTLSYFEISGSIGKYALDFLHIDCVNRRLSKITIITYKSTINRFLKKMKFDNVDIHCLNEIHILNFITSLPYKGHSVLTPIRNFLRYLYNESILLEDLSELVSRFNVQERTKLPSYYSVDEISRLESSIIRTNPTGKCNFAIIVLASRIGLRASDIVNLKFSNIDWDNSTIRLSQSKTGDTICLPLLSIVGDALIDYIKNGRPKSSHKNIFLTHFVGTPCPLKGGTLSTIVSNHIKKAGICTRGRHHGSHSLRHSLATALLNQNTQLPIISEVLGHQSSASTMYYLGIDIAALLDCSLNVPCVNEAFYTQNGGFFYE